jgi:hypothetical protein
MKRIAKVAAVGAAGLGLILGATPAHATTGALVFTGTATTSALSTPGTGGAVANGTWTFTGAGVGATSAGVVDDAAGAAASGSLHVGIVNQLGGGAFCGASGGSDGTGTVKVGATVSIRDVGWIQSAATVIVFSGDTVNASGNVSGGLAGVVSAIPPVPGVVGAGSCLSGTATGFTIVGAGVATF